MDTGGSRNVTGVRKQRFGRGSMQAVIHNEPARNFPLLVLRPTRVGGHVGTDGPLSQKRRGAAAAPVGSDRPWRESSSHCRWKIGTGQGQQLMASWIHQQYLRGCRGICIDDRTQLVQDFGEACPISKHLKGSLPSYARQFVHGSHHRIISSSYLLM